MKKTVTYISEGRVEFFEVTDGRIDGDYIIVHSTILLEVYNLTYQCLVLYKGDMKLCTVYKSRLISEPVATCFTDECTLTLPTVEHIYRMLSFFDTIIANLPLNYEVNVSKAERDGRLWQMKYTNC